MRIFDVAAFIFVFTLSLNIISELLGVHIPTPIFDIPKPAEFSPTPGDVYGVSTIFYAIGLFFKIFLQATILLPLVLQNLGVPTIINTTITGVVWFIYAVGVIQFLRGMNIE